MPTWSKTIAILVNYTCKRLINIEPSTNLLIPCTSTLCMYTGHQISQIKDQPFSFSALIVWNLTFFPKVWICFWFIVWFLQNIGTYFFITIIELTGHYLINDHNLFHYLFCRVYVGRRMVQVDLWWQYNKKPNERLWTKKSPHLLSC